MRRVQDPVHGLMEFEGVEALVVDLLRTPELQRMRRIRQTGLAHMVFPGLEHSRLAHSLGVAHLALRFGRHLKQVGRDWLPGMLVPDELALRDLAVAALCHDIGHGPTSHAWERGIVGEGFDRDRWLGSLQLEAQGDRLARAKWHELVGYGLLLWSEGPLHRLLETHERGLADRVRLMLQGEYYLRYLPRLLSSDVDVDRADYIARDAYQSGVAYGRYDLDWLVSTCSIGFQQPKSDAVIGFERPKAAKVVEQFLVARGALYDTVYHHKTVRAVEGMVELFLRSCRDLGAETFRSGQFIRSVSRILGGDALRPSELMELDDYALWVFMGQVAHAKKTKDSVAADLAGRILSRTLFKLVPCPQLRLQAFLARTDGMSLAHEAVKPYVGGLDPKYYVYLDVVDYDWFAQTPDHVGFFINPDRSVEQLRHSEELRDFASHGKHEYHLYTIQEAVGAVSRVLDQLDH